MFQPNMFDGHHLLDMIHKTPESEMEMLRDEEFESKSATDIMEAPLSGDDDQDQDHDPNQRPKKKRYHRHTQHQIQEMEAWAFPLAIILNYQHLVRRKITDLPNIHLEEKHVLLF